VLRAKMRRNYGFTLVELLVAIAIIGVLAAILVPTAYVAFRRAKLAAIKIEVTNLSTAIEQYKQKYGDYPPDGANWDIIDRHMRKAFPRMLATELVVLRAACGASGSGPFPNGVMNRSESLAFFLGGFSTDPQRPLTGPGGPFIVAGGSPVYNTDRENAIYDFPQGTLTLDTADETEFGMLALDGSLSVSAEPVDIMPAVRTKGTKTPMVYFDSRSYEMALSPTTRYHSCFMNGGGASPAFGVARPYVSVQVSTATGSLKYMQDKTFQIVSAGLDGNFGGIALPAVVLFQFPTGDPITVSGSASVATRYHAQNDSSA